MNGLLTRSENAKCPKRKLGVRGLLGTLHVYVNKPPLAGKANTAAIESLANYFKTKKGNILLVSGMRSKNKVFEIGNEK